MSYVPQPPDAEHEWRFDATRREWFYLVNGNHRVYYDSTPRNIPNVRPSGPGQQFQTPNASSVSNYRVAPSGSQPIATRSGPASQSGGGPIASPNFATSPQLAGFSPSSQSLGTGRFLSGTNAPQTGPGFSPPTNVLRTGPGRGGRYVPPANSPPAGAGRGGGYIPTVNSPPSGSGQGGGYKPSAGGPPPGHVPSGSSQLTVSQRKYILDAGP
jgi:hypothetical protein